MPLGIKIIATYFALAIPVGIAIGKWIKWRRLANDRIAQQMFKDLKAEQVRRHW